MLAVRPLLGFARVRGSSLSLPAAVRRGLGSNNGDDLAKFVHNALGSKGITGEAAKEVATKLKAANIVSVPPY